MVEGTQKVLRAMGKSCQWRCELLKFARGGIRLVTCIMICLFFFNRVRSTISCIMCIGNTKSTRCRLEGPSIITKWPQQLHRQICARAPQKCVHVLKRVVKVQPVRRRYQFKPSERLRIKLDAIGIYCW